MNKQYKLCADLRFIIVFIHVTCNQYEKTKMLQEEAGIERVVLTAEGKEKEENTASGVGHKPEEQEVSMASSVAEHRQVKRIGVVENTEPEGLSMASLVVGRRQVENKASVGRMQEERIGVEPEGGFRLLELELVASSCRCHRRQDQHHHRRLLI